MIVVLTTCQDRSSSDRLARSILEAGLAGCVQVLPKMTSYFLWNGELQSEDEHLLLIKTLPGKYDEIDAHIRANHTYEVPEIVAIDVLKVNEQYREWLVGLLS